MKIKEIESRRCRRRRSNGFGKAGGLASSRSLAFPQTADQGTYRSVHTHSFTQAFGSPSLNAAASLARSRLTDAYVFFISAQLILI